VYVDFLQNREAQTLACAYSVRPRPGATVSTPLRWEEVTPNLCPADFTIRTLARRLDSVGDLFAPVLGEGIDMTAALEAISNTRHAVKLAAG
jgi:bifunctional non-homologous end joining protein LigD